MILTTTFFRVSGTSLFDRLRAVNLVLEESTCRLKFLSRNFLLLKSFYSSPWRLLLRVLIHCRSLVIFYYLEGFIELHIVGMERILQGTPSATGGQMGVRRCALSFTQKVLGTRGETSLLRDGATLLTRRPTTYIVTLLFNYY